MADKGMDNPETEAAPLPFEPASWMGLAEVAAPVSRLPVPARGFTTPNLAPASAAAVETIHQRVAAALRAEIGAMAARGIRLYLPLEGAVPGLTGVSLALGPDRLDVVLVTGPGGLPRGLRESAATLALRLQQLQGRAVRVGAATARPGAARPATGRTSMADTGREDLA